MKRANRIGPVAVGLFFISFKRETRLLEQLASTASRILPIPEGGLEVPILMHHTHENKAISSKMEILVRKQVEKIKKTFDVETLAEENFSENSPEENPTCAEEDEEKEGKE